MSQHQQFKKKVLPAAISAVALSAAYSGAVSAQGNSRMEEVVVTAQYREQTVQDIPYNISAMTGDEISAQLISDQADLLRVMSGVSVVDRGYRNSGTVNSIIIRGLNVDNGLNGDVSLNAVPTVGTYVDNVPLFANFVIKDVQRVEVLRGPQGTLYGSGSLGGTVRYISNKPDTEEFSAKVSGNFGQTDGSNGNNINVDGLINIPMGGVGAFRAYVGRIDNDGVIDYINAYQLNEFREPLIDDNAGGCIDPRGATSRQVLDNGACYESIEDADYVEIDYAKASFLVEPTESLSFLLSYQRQEDEVGARRAITLGDNGQAPGSANYYAYGDDDSGQVLLEPSSREVEMVSLDVEVDMGFATFTSTTAQYDHEGVGESDNGGLWVSGGRDWSSAFYGGWARPAMRAERGYTDETLVQEFRLVSNETKAGIDWIVGAFYQDQETHVFQNSWNPGMDNFYDACRAESPDLANPDPSCAGFWPRWYAGGLTERDFEYVRDVSFKEKAIYGELTYNFTDNFRMTGGFRWFDNETTNDSIVGFPLVEGWTSSVIPTSTDDDSGLLLKLNASLDVTEEHMIYGTISEGYRRGGANAIPDAGFFAEPNPETVRTFEKDSVTNYELGLKGDHDNVNYTASLFYVDWKDPQLNTVTAAWAFFMAANGERASTQGIEFEAEGYMTDSLHYRVGYTHLRAVLEEDFTNPQTGNVIAESTSTLPGTPKNVFSFSLDNTWGVGNELDLVGRVGGYYQSKSENNIDNDSVLNETHESFWLWGASATLQSEAWYATLYAKNLTNEEGVTGSFPEEYWGADTGTFEGWLGNGNRQFITQPRTIGLSVGYNF